MVDVLIIAALPMEFDAVKTAGTAMVPGSVGVARWEPRNAGGMAPYLLGEFVGPHDVTLSVALARSVHMGSRTVSPVTSSLVGALRPRCLAMSGVCAGNPARTALGDVIVPSLVYAFEEGKFTPTGSRGRHRQIPVDERIVRAAQDLSTADLPSFRVPTAEDAKLWYLEQLLAGREPRNHPARDRYFAPGEWKSSLAMYEKEGLITRHGAQAKLTDDGRVYIEHVLYDDVDGPDTLPFKVVVGPMATVNAVMERPETWDELSGMGVHDVTGLEMEAAAIATVAETEQVPFFVVAKGVMDHAINKEDRYKRFAAEAAAEVLFALLLQVAETIKRSTGDGTRAAEPDWRTQLGRRGLRIWTSKQFHAGLRLTDPAVPPPPFRQHEFINVTTLEAGRLPNLALEFDGVGRAFDGWVRGERRKRGADGFRVLWLVNEEGPHRSKALLAALSRAQNAGRVVYDAGRDLELGAEAIRELGLAELPTALALIAVDLPGHQPSAGWIALLHALDALRRYENPDERLTTPSSDPVVLAIAGTAAQEQLAYGILQSAIEIDPIDVRGNPRPRPYSFARAESLASPSVPAAHIFNRGLPETAPQLFGRGDEVKKLRDAWLNPGVRVMTVVAAGGVGKSALVNHWLRDLRDRDYLGAQRILAWSFYSQGTKENLVAADVFVRFALDWLGDNEPLPTNPAAQGARLAALIRRHRMLLVLDGLEPLQYPETAPDVGGTLTDSSIATLLRELAAPGWEGLCLITTRVPVAGITAPGSDVAAIDQLDLRNLDIRSGVSLLESLIGPQQNSEEAEKAVAAVHGHALAVNLLGRYLRDAYGGRLSGRFGIERLSTAVADGGHAQRIMELYDEWLRQYDRLGELAILDVIGLFDRPAPFPAIAAVLADTNLDRVMPGLSEFDGPEWQRCVADLRRMGLLAGETAGMPGTLDAHPLVREHFRDRLQRLSPALWEAGNLSLYRYYQQRAPELPANAADMNLLYAAVNHGCAIGRHQEVYDEVLVPRIWRGARESYSTRILGMTGSEIVALSNYFVLPAWIRLREIKLVRQARVLVMSSAALRLRQLGRPDDALASCRTLSDLLTDKAADAEPIEVADAAYASSLYCELLIIAGLLETPRGGEHGARDAAETAIAFADQCPDAYFKMYSRSCLAEVEFMTGDFEAAREQFAEAAAIAVAEKSNMPFLYSQNLYRYGYFAIETGDAATLLADAERDPQWGLASRPSQLSYAIRLLVLSAARRAMAEAGAPADLTQAATETDDAIVIFRGVGYTDYTVRGLLERAHLRQVRARPEDYAGALYDLDEAEAETTRSHMTLLTADVHLQRVACHLSVWPTQPAGWRADMVSQVVVSLNEASDLVRSLGYRRRNGLLRRLRAQCREYGIIVN